jgi:hypothetical protein
MGGGVAVEEGGALGSAELGIVDGVAEGAGEGEGV